MLSLYHLDLVTAATLFSFIIYKQEIMDLQAKENIKGILQFIYTKEGTKFSRMRTQSRNTIYTNMIPIYKTWQPSLVLGSLGRARLVPIAFSGSNLGLALQPQLRVKILAHSLEVSKKKVTSVSDNKLECLSLASLSSQVCLGTSTSLLRKP